MSRNGYGLTRSSTTGNPESGTPVQSFPGEGGERRVPGPGVWHARPCAVHAHHLAHLLDGGVRAHLGVVRRRVAWHGVAAAAGVAPEI